MTLLERFLTKIDKQENHWIWIGAFYGSGYGVIRDENQELDGAHRVSFRLFKGPIPKDKHVLHVRSCSVKACVRPDHLYAGTRSENIQDALAVGAMNPPVGMRSGRRVLTEEQVLAIRKDPRFPREIAKELGVGKNTVYYAKTGRTWASAVGGV